MPIGAKEAKSEGGTGVGVIFKLYSLGVNTNRDQWVYDYDITRLKLKILNTIEVYNSELSRWLRSEKPKDIDAFLLKDDKKIKWSSRLKELLVRRVEAKFEVSAIRNALYRPFVYQYLYFDNVLIHRKAQLPKIFPTQISEAENCVIIVGGYGRKEFSVFVAQQLPDINFYADPAQCFPLYVYDEGGGNRRENITDWALAQFQAQYGAAVTKRDIFNYVYAVLHHPQYRERYAENLKRELPRIPLVAREDFQAFVDTGARLAELHLSYESAPEHPLDWIENKDIPFSWRVTKMKLTPARDAVVVNESLTLAGIPPEVFAYRLGNRSALEWVIDQYQVSADRRSGIVSDPNREGDEQYIARLVGRVVTVSVETVRLIAGLPERVVEA